MSIKLSMIYFGKIRNIMSNIYVILCLILLTVGTWTKGDTAKFGYDFWYQPYWNVLVSSEWGTPKDFKIGFNADHINNIGIHNIYLIKTKL